MVQQSPGAQLFNGQLLNSHMQSALRIESITRLLATVAVTPTDGSIVLVFFYSKWALTVSRLGMQWNSVVESGHVLTRLGIYTGAYGGDWTLVARTADLGAHTDGLAEDTDYPLATTGGYPASYALRIGQLYGLALFNHATTTRPNMIGNAGSVNKSLAPAVARSISGQSDLLATIHESDWTGAGPIIPWIYGIP